MIGNIKKISSLFILLALLASAAYAKTVSTVDIGGTKFYLPIPQGYVDGPTAAPAMHSMFSNMISGPALLKTSFIKASDVRKFVSEGGTDLETYYGVMTVRKTEFHHVAQADFDKLRNGLADAQQGMAAKLAPRLAENFERLNRKDAVAPNVQLSIKPGEIFSLGVDENSPSKIIYTTLSSFTDSSEPNQAAITTISVSAVMFMKNKILMVVLYKNFSETKDVSQARSELRNLTRAIAMANP